MASVPTKSSGKRRAPKKDFESKSERAKLAESAKIRNEYPAGAISKANIQVLKSSGDKDAYYVSKKLVTDPTASAKAKIAVQLENPGVNLIFIAFLIFQVLTFYKRLA